MSTKVFIAQHQRSIACTMGSNKFRTVFSTTTTKLLVFGLGFVPMASRPASRKIRFGHEAVRIFVRC